MFNVSCIRKNKPINYSLLKLYIKTSYHISELNRIYVLGRSFFIFLPFQTKFYFFEMRHQGERRESSQKRRFFFICCFLFFINQPFFFCFNMNFGHHISRVYLSQFKYFIFKVINICIIN